MLQGVEHLLADPEANRRIEVKTSPMPEGVEQRIAPPRFPWSFT